MAKERTAVLIEIVVIIVTAAVVGTVVAVAETPTIFREGL